MRLHVKRLAILLATAIAMVLLGPSGNTPAHADLMQCPYPATGFQAVVQPLIGQAVGYICNYPVERGLQHLHAELGSYSLSGQAGTQGVFTGGPTQGNVSFGIGMSLWSQSWRCPDERYIAAPPNGIGAWKDPQDFKGIKCPAVSRAPLALNAPWPPEDPNIVVVVNQVLAPGQPDPTAAPPADVPPPAAPDAVPPADPGATPAIISPVPLNPVPLKPNGQ